MSPSASQPRLILIGGGARSGKSAFALRRAAQLPAPRFFLATAQALDDEMRARIARHRAERAADLSTIEEPLAVAEALAHVPADAVVVIDCLTLWISNLLGRDVAEPDILARVDALAAAAAARPGPTLVVSNEVGLGLVPPTPLGRVFRDVTGGAHQRLAAAADEIYAAVMGVVLRLHPAPVVAVQGPGTTAPQAR